MKLNNGKKYNWWRHDLNDNIQFLAGQPEYYREDDFFVRSIIKNHDPEPNFKTASKIDYIIDNIKNKAD